MKDKNFHPDFRRKTFSIVKLSQAAILQDELGAKVVKLSGKGHFSGLVDDEESCLQLSEALNAVLNL